MPEETVGHNSAAPSEIRDFLNAQKERTAEITQIREIIKEDFARMKSRGYDVKALRLLLKRATETKAQRAAREETEEFVEIYGDAIGMFG